MPTGTTASAWQQAKWIKIMHDDDWFAHERSLEVYAANDRTLSGGRFYLRGYGDIENGKIIGTRIPDPALTKRLSQPARPVHP